MKRVPIFSISALVLLISLLTSCYDFPFDCMRGNGIVVTEERNLQYFNGIVSEGDYDVDIIIDTVSKVVIEADENLIPFIRTHVRNNNLIIDNSTRRCFHTKDNRPIRIYAHTPDINFVELAGSGIIYSDYLIYVHQLRVELTGSGLVDLRNIDAIEVDALLTGSGVIELWGICEEGDFDIAGSGQIKSFHLEQDNCYASISGSGDMYIFVYDFLDANISGSGNIFYKGNPQVNMRITGSGSVINSNK